MPLDAEGPSSEPFTFPVRTRPISAYLSCSWFAFAANQSPAIIPNMSDWWTASRTLTIKLIETHIRSSTLTPRGPNLEEYLIYDNATEVLVYQIITNALNSLSSVLVMIERQPM